ncbi:HOS3-like histone deacetylase [Penicillium argentinense]|uniref:HOS3-like histone deacetylase n=1 Tax=Penicillium argentinense TaxID=1131581 RepID=A0A9W9EZ18_9EURO|nr:HOS3-like histone deacetylase [Penicillium argentinense]KAJ5090506.1 HOS3-like histone deacetylase [Penicillium argentinense]
MSSAGDRKADRADRAADQAASEEKPREERKVSRGRSPRKPSSSTRTPRSKSAVSTKSTPTTPKSAPAKAKSARGTTPPLPVPPVGLGVGVNVGAADENKEKFPMGLDGAPDMARVILPWEMTTEKATETSIAEPMYSASKPAETMTPSLPTTRPVESNYVSTGISQPHTPEMATMPDASTLSYPNTFSPATTAAYTKQGLPVFTSSSPIPFAPTDQQPRTQPLPQLPLQESAHQPRHVPNDEDSPLQAPPPPPIVNNFSQNPRFYSQ